MSQPAGIGSRGLRDRIERGFESWGRFTCRHAVALIVGMLLLSGVLISRVPTLGIDTSTDSFLYEDDPIRVVYDDFRRRFGRDERISIAIEAPDLFSAETLERLRALHQDLVAGVPHLEDITSLVNARSTRGEGDQLIVGDLMEEWPETGAQREALRQQVLANPLYRNLIISKDASVTVIALELVTYTEEGKLGELAGFDTGGEEPGGEERPFLKDYEIQEAVVAARAVVERHRAPGFELRMAGGPVMTERLNVRMMGDMRRFTALSIVAIALFLFLLFRRVAAVFLPLVVVVLSMFSTLGVMAWVGGKITVGTQILPSFLLAVGICDAVHILAIFYRRVAAGDGREAAICFTLGHSGLAILMTSVTTAGGLASFAAGSLAPVADLGIYAPFGVMFAFVFTVVLMPASLALIPVRRVESARQGSDWVGRLLVGIGDFSARHPWGVVAVTTGILVISGVGASRLLFSHNPMDWFPESEPFREATLYMNERMDGVNVVEILVDTGGENGVHEPALLNRVEEIQRRAEATQNGAWRVGKAFSIVDVLKEIHQALNENRSEYYAVPQDRRLVAQELLLFEQSGSDDLEDVVDPLFTTARVTLRVPWMDALAYPEELKALRSSAQEAVGEGTAIELTGLVPVLSQTFLAMIHSMARSYVIAIVVILPLMVLLIGHLGRGLLSMIPNLTPVIMVLGYMGWSRTPVDGMSMMVGAIVIGLAVDDTIHFMHNFRRYYERSGDARLAIRETLQTTGRALLLTSLVLFAGFSVFLGAYMSNVRTFGFLAGAAILVAFVANVVLASSLMVLATRRRARAAAA